LPEEVGGVKANCEIPKVLPSQKVFLLEMNGSGNIKRGAQSMEIACQKGTRK
jgi:hypothetical protein